MTTLRFAGGAAGAACMLLACTALTGIGDLVVETPDSSVVVDASSSSSSSSSGSADIPDASEDAPADAQVDAAEAGPSLTFFDDFTRPNSATIGNGWVAKTPGYFLIDSNSLLMSGDGMDDENNVQLFRPDAVLDVRAEIDMIYPASDTGIVVSPELALRVSQASMTDRDVYDGYFVYLFRDYGAISRAEIGSTMTTDLNGGGISPPLETGVSYHLTFMVTGINPVALTATVTRNSDAVVMATYSAIDSSEACYATAGFASIGGTQYSGGRLDNYLRTTLP